MLFLRKFYIYMGDFMPEKIYSLPPNEEEARRIEQREKQVNFGRVTQGYKNYYANKVMDNLDKFPELSRPKTPNKYLEISKRSMDAVFRAWRVELHKWDNIDTPNGYTEKEEWQNEVAPNIEVAQQMVALINQGTAKPLQTIEEEKSALSSSESEEEGDECSFLVFDPKKAASYFEPDSNSDSSMANLITTMNF
ncbi:MAG: hypothetical protein A3F18_03595 [Legionellales bacterium RIFCSPHIGHO2_12_FULL_37_14]|nr:MAG: hypothetical protein A3F18_03595 [Legionellales bacterium RIFCSPHIGHO2_12_FULL_37_14]